MSISVLMSIYFKENPVFFQQAMESIWDAQTLKPDEIILIEDGKLTDQLYKVIEFWKNKLGEAIKIVKLENNNGLTKALNIGLKYCTCEFIARMDTDDLSAPQRFEKQVNFLKNNESVHVVGGSIQEFNTTNKNLNIRSYPKGDKEIRKYILKASPLAHPSVMFRKSIFDDGVKYPEKYRTSQDIALWYKLLSLGYKIANIDDVIYFLRINDDFYSRRSRQKAINEFKIYWYGILDLKGVTWELVYPLSRLIFRLLPNTLVKKIYTSRLRKKMLN